MTKRISKSLQSDLVAIECLLMNIVSMCRGDKAHLSIYEIEQQAIKALKHLPEVRKGQVAELLAIVNRVPLSEVRNNCPHLS